MPPTFNKKQEEYRNVTPNAFPPPFPSRDGSFVVNSSPKIGKNTSAADSPTGRKSNLYTKQSFRL